VRQARKEIVRFWVGARQKNPRSVKIWRKNRKLLVKRKLLRCVSLARRAGITIGDVREEDMDKGRKKRNDGGFWAMKAQKSVNGRFHDLFADPILSTIHRRRSNRRFAEHENQRRPSLSFTPTRCRRVLIVQLFSQKHHFLYHHGMYD